MKEKVKKMPGYKSSPLGLIPKDWEIEEFGKFTELEKEKFNPVDNESLKCLELEHFEQGTGNILGWINSSEQKSTKNKFKKGQVLFGKLRPYLQKYWHAEFDGVCSSEVWVLNSKTKKCNNDYLFRLIQHNHFIQVANVSSGSKMPRADWDYVSSFPFPLPPLSEQTAIANLLSTWDKAIQTTNALITLKQKRKKWLMQMLLTGKKRLKGFEKEKWKEVRFGDITRNFSNRNKEIKDARVYSVTNSNGFVLQSEHFSREIAGDDLSNYKIIKKNEFAYNPARINVGSIAYFEKEIGIISSLYVCFATNKDVEDFFLQEVLKLDHTKHKIGAYGEGGVRIYLWYDLFKKIKIELPSVDNQKAVCKILKLADKEIELLIIKLNQLKEQKKGLMQILLTGKKRLKH